MKYYETKRLNILPKSLHVRQTCKRNSIIFTNNSLGRLGKTHNKKMDEEFDDYMDDEESCYRDCPKCGRTYDDIGYDYQYCKVCGWDAENEKWDKPIKPKNADYMAGEADILTGRWY